MTEGVQTLCAELQSLGYVPVTALLPKPESIQPGLLKKRLVPIGISVWVPGSVYKMSPVSNVTVH